MFQLLLYGVEDAEAEFIHQIRGFDSGIDPFGSGIVLQDDFENPRYLFVCIYVGGIFVLAEEIGIDASVSGYLGHRDVLVSGMMD